MLSVPHGAAYNGFDVSYSPTISQPHTFMDNPTPPETWTDAGAANGEGVLIKRSTAGVIEGVVWVCGISATKTASGLKTCYTAPLGSSIFTERVNVLPFPTCHGPDTYVEVNGRYHYIGGKGTSKY